MERKEQKQNEQWKHFSQTGDIRDYLCYVASTREVGDKDDVRDYSDRNGIVSDVGWRG